MRYIKEPFVEQLQSITTVTKKIHSTRLKSIKQCPYEHCLSIDKAASRLTTSLPIWRYLKYPKLMVQELQGDFKNKIF